MPTSNLLLLTDSYKPSHWKQYPPDTRHIFSHMVARGGWGGFTEVVANIGLQYLLREYLEPGFDAPDVEEADELFIEHFGSPDVVFNRRGWYNLLEKHNGHLPLRIRAVPEGTVVPIGHVLLTVENTDPEFPWLTNYVESLLVQTWYPSTVATQSRAMKRTILKWLDETGDPSLIPFKLHDFGFRGSTSVESSAIGGFAHLVNFQGTDTVPALEFAYEYYWARMAGFSIPAAEHSTICSWGREHERDAFENMLRQFPKGLVAVVSDTYNVFEACANLWGRDLREQVMERDGVLVVRPDSGELPDTIVRVIRILGDRFGFETNDKGFKVLHPKVRLIQGDGIEYHPVNTIEVVLKALAEDKWSADNIAFGSGGGLLQKVDRDMCGYAFKASSRTDEHGVSHDLVKSPVGDARKASRGGRLTLVRGVSGPETVRLEDVNGRDEMLQTVFLDGVVMATSTLADIRARAEIKTPQTVGA